MTCYVVVTSYQVVHTCRAKRAKTIRQNIVSVMTSASCFTAFSKALMIVFKPEKEEAKA